MCIEVGCNLFLIAILFIILLVVIIICKNCMNCEKICQESKNRELMYFKYIFDICKDKREFDVTLNINPGESNWSIHINKKEN